MNYETQKLMFSSKTVEWGTPKELYNMLDQEFHFTLDPCPLRGQDGYPSENQKDGLSMSWANQIVFCNPPYGREIEKWVMKGYYSSFENSTVVMLLPARIDTQWFNWCMKGEIRRIVGRVRFTNNQGLETPAPFPSLIVVFHNGNNQAKQATQ